MTIAMGLMARNGLVLAADSEQTIGDLKLRTDKVWATYTATQRGGETMSRSCVTIGAGTGSCLDALFAQFRAVVRDEKLSDQEVEAGFRRTLEEFHARHIAPFAHYRESDRPWVQLIIGVQLPQPRLLYSWENLLQDAPRPFVAVGAGVTMAAPLLERFYSAPLPSIGTAVLIAAYIMYHTKEFVSGCGKTTEILGFVGDHEFVIPTPVVQEIELAIGYYDVCVEAPMLREIGGEDISDKKSVATEARERLSRLIAGLNLGPDSGRARA